MIDGVLAPVEFAAPEIADLPAVAGPALMAFKRLPRKPCPLFEFDKIMAIRIKPRKARDKPCRSET